MSSSQTVGSPHRAHLLLHCPSDHADGQCSFAGGDDPCLSYASTCPETWQPRQLRGEGFIVGDSLEADSMTAVAPSCL